MNTKETGAPMTAKPYKPRCSCPFVSWYGHRPFCHKYKEPRTHSPITGEPYPKCKVDGCTRNVYAAGCCYGHQSSSEQTPK